MASAATSPTIIVTGYEPFLDYAVNPSWEAVRVLPDEVEGAHIVKLQLPVVYDAAADVLFRAVDACAPRAVINVGLASGRRKVSLERVAINVDYTDRPDNLGVVRQGSLIDPAGPVGYFGTLPYEAILDALAQEGIPVEYSYHAGTYLCNHIMYEALHRAQTGDRGYVTGFVHVPLTPGLAVGDHEGKPVMDQSVTDKAILSIVATTARSIR